MHLPSSGITTVMIRKTFVGSLQKMQLVPTIISDLSLFQISNFRVRNNSPLPLFHCKRKEGTNPPGSLQCTWPWELRASAKQRTWHLMTLRWPTPSTNHLAQFQFHLPSGLCSWHGKPGQQFHDVQVLLVFYPEPMPAHFTECPNCRKIYHSIHLHLHQIINDFRNLLLFLFWTEYIAILSLSGLSEMGRIAKMWASPE